MANTGARGNGTEQNQTKENEAKTANGAKPEGQTGNPANP